VWEAKEYCDDMFGYENADFDGAKLLQCYGENSIPKGQEFCENTFEGNGVEEIDKRIECFDEIDLIDSLVCETKYNSTTPNIGYNFNNETF
jgi:hypothetical protein